MNDAQQRPPHETWQPWEVACTVQDARGGSRRLDGALARLGVSAEQRECVEQAIGDALASVGLSLEVP